MNLRIVLGIALAIGGCKKHEDAPPPAPTPPTPVVKPLPMQASTVIGNGLTVTAQHPGGWSETVLDPPTTHQFSDPTPALAFPSTVTIGADCVAPPCGALPEDPAKVADAMSKTLTSSGATDVQVSTKPLDDGFEVELTGTPHTGPVHVYARARWQTGWKAEAICIAATADTMLAHHAQLDDACRAVDAKPAP